jgi:hypothetical protein
MIPLRRKILLETFKLFDLLIMVFSSFEAIEDKVK